MLVVLPLDRYFRPDHAWRIQFAVDKHEFGGVREADFISIVKPLADSNFWIEGHRRAVFDEPHQLCADNGVGLPHHGRDQKPKSESAKHSYANGCFTKFIPKQKQAISKRKLGRSHVQQISGLSILLQGDF